MNDIFKIIVNEEKVHPKVKLLNSGWDFAGQKEIINSWSRNFVDKDGKFIKEFQTTFHSSFWELFLFTVFRYLGFKISNEQVSPDFSIIAPFKMKIEAVTANVKHDGKKGYERLGRQKREMFMPLFKSSNFEVYMDEAITRYSNAFMTKSKECYPKYLKRGQISEEEPFLIALASFDQVNYGREFIYPMRALLYGEYYDVESKKFKKKESIIKPNTQSEVPIGLFNDKKYENVSAVIFTCTLTIGKLTALALSLDMYENYPNSVINTRYNFNSGNFVCQIVGSDNPETITDGLFIFHNPNAKNKVPIDVFNCEDITQIYYDDNENKVLISSSEYPIVARVDYPTLNNKEFIEALVLDIIHNCNG